MDSLSKILTVRIHILLTKLNINNLFLNTILVFCDNFFRWLEIDLYPHVQARQCLVLSKNKMRIVNPNIICLIESVLNKPRNLLSFNQNNKI